MHPQLGIPQLYHDQLNVIGEHLWQLKNDPEWHEDVEEAQPILEVMKNDTLSELSSEDKAALENLIFKARAVKKANLFETAKEAYAANSETAA